MSASVPSASGLRARAAVLVESAAVQRFVIAVILVNAVTLGMETSPAVRAATAPWLGWLDALALAIFVAELSIKLWAHGPRFFRSGWNVFDLVVVGIALVPASGPFAVLRALRVLRVLRLTSMMPQLRFVVEALLRALPGIGAIAGLMLILFYVFAVIATGLFGERFPEWFGSLGASLYTLFQIMTLDSWSSGMARPVMQTFPWAWAFFIPFVLVATFTMLNLFIAIIVNTMQVLHARGDMDQAPDPESDPAQEIRALRGELAGLRQWLEAREKTPR